MVSTFFADLLSKILNPLIEKIALGVIEKFKEYQKAQEIGRIDDAVKSSTDAVTSEDVKKAAHDAANATSHL